MTYKNWLRNRTSYRSTKTLSESQPPTSRHPANLRLSRISCIHTGPAKSARDTWSVSLPRMVQPRSRSTFPTSPVWERVHILGKNAIPMPQEQELLFRQRWLRMIWRFSRLIRAENSGPWPWKHGVRLHRVLKGHFPTLGGWQKAIQYADWAASFENIWKLCHLFCSIKFKL